MKKTFTIEIKEPCHEDWDEMTPTDRGAFCATCNKEVIDFRYKTKYQISQAMKGSSNVCGRFYDHQLNKPINVSPQSDHRWKRIAAALISIFTFYRVHAAEPDEIHIPKDSLSIIDTSRSVSPDTTASYRCMYITGRVFDSRTNHPIAYAQVKVLGTGLIITSDSVGHFILDTSLVANDSLRLLIKSENYETRYISLESDTFYIDIALSPKYTICTDIMGDVAFISEVISPSIIITGYTQMPQEEEYPGFKQSIKSIFFQRDEDESGLSLKQDNDLKNKRKSYPIIEKLNLWIRTRRNGLTDVLKG